MNRNPYIRSEASTHAGSTTARWRALMLTLVLTLSFGSWSQPVRAQEGDPDVFVYSDIEASLPKDICVGEIGTTRVRVVRTLQEIATRWKVPFIRSGIGINATGGTGVVSLLQTKLTTGFDPDLPGWAEFEYRGEKAGTAELVFTTDNLSKLAGEKLDDPYSDKLTIKVQVRVIHCIYEVTTISKWNVGMTSVGMIEKAQLKRGEDGSFTASTSMNWVTSILCGIKSPLEPSQVELTGTINESGQLEGKITFGPASSSGGGSCTVGITTENAITADPLTFTTSSAGVLVSTQAHVVKAKNGSFPGSVNIFVYPVDGDK